jgi:mRNA interferase MazF
MKLTRGDIIDINLDPVKGSEQGKTRPCIVVTNDVYNKILPIVQVVPVTAWSEKKSQIKTNVELLSNKKNGLIKKSIADCLQTRPVDVEKRLIKKRGKLDKEYLQKIDSALKIVFQL